MMYDKILMEHEKIKEQIVSLEKQINEQPKGKLICAANGKGYKWYISDEQGINYLPKKERKLAEKLAYKKYLSLQLENLIQEKNALEAYLKSYNSKNLESEQAFLNSPKYQELLNQQFKPLSEELQEWIHAPYQRNEKNPEKLVHKTYSGQMVRSKSEALIAMFLHKNKIPFRYECLLQIGDTAIYPDFTIRHPKTGELFYWEHFGMMDNPSYYKNVLSKYQFYFSNGIIPTIQLITTYETKEHPLCIETVEKVVEEYFLS